MSDDIHSVHLRRLQGRLGQIVYEMTRIQFSQFATPKNWTPAINAYLCHDQMVLCVDLAGVNRAEVELQVEPRRLILRGQRQPPEPNTDQRVVQVLAMEIDYGRFERVVNFPCDVESARIRAEQQNGLLWVYVPLRCQS